MSNQSVESLEHRLAKRRQLRNKRFLDKNSVDESTTTSINQSPKTQSLDRRSSKRITALSSEQQKSSSSTMMKNPELPPTDVPSNHKINPPQTAKHRSLDSDNGNQTSSKSLSTNDENSHPHHSEKPVIMKEIVSPPVTTAHSHLHHDEKPVTVKEIVATVVPPITPSEKSTPIQQNSHTVQHEKSMVIKEMITPILPPITTEKSDPIFQETREYSTPNHLRNYSCNSEEHPLSYPQSTNYHQERQFHYPPFHSKPITRTISEQIVSTTKYKHQPVHSVFAKHNSLALPYLFSKRLIDAEMARTSSLDSEQTHRKTAWE